jgi:hypothetical protein
MRFRLPHLILLGAAVLYMGCTPITAPTQVPAEPVLDLGQSVTLGDFGFEMEMPAAWTARVQDSATLIEASPGACDSRTDDCITHDYRSLDFMRAMGLPEDAAVEDLMALNRDFFSWEELSEPEPAELFGEPALGIRYFDEVYGYLYTGLRGDQAFLLGVASPTAEGLDAILPTFRAMIDTIRPTSE